MTRDGPGPGVILPVALTSANQLFIVATHQPTSLKIFNLVLLTAALTNLLGASMTSRRLRKLRRENSPAALLAEARERRAEDYEIRFPDDYQIRVIDGEFWPDAARWRPEP
jgi:hypothetical protein